MLTIRAVLEYLGSTGLGVASLLREIVLRELGYWPGFWQGIEAETTSERPNLPEGWQFEPLGAPLEELYEDRAALGIPQGLQDAPKDLYQSTFYGASKMPATAAIAFAVHAAEMNAAREQAWWRKDEDAFEALHRLQQRYPGAEAALEPPIVFLTGAAGGSTGHAGILHGADYWLGHKDRPLVTAYLLGPRAGGTWDDYKTEGANCVDLLLSLQARAQAHPGRLWVFWLDAPAARRQALIRETAALQAELLMRPAGQELRRMLVDGFTIAARQSALPGEPPRFLCRVDLFRKEISADGLRDEKSLGVLAEVLDEFGGRR